MAYLSRVTYLSVSGGQTAFPVTFPYIDQTHVGVFVGVVGGDPFQATPLVPSVDYNWTSSGVIATTAPHDGFDIHIRRSTPSQVDALSGGTLTAQAQNRIDLQLLYLTQEVTDAAADLTARVLQVPVGGTPLPVADLAGAADGLVLGTLGGQLQLIPNNSVSSAASALAAATQAGIATNEAATATAQAGVAAAQVVLATAQVALATTQASASATSATASSASAAFSQLEAGLSANSASIAQATILGLPYFPLALNGSTSAGGGNILPQGITSGAVGGTAITGAVVGTYPLAPTGGSFTGVTANLVVTSATAATIVVTNPGRTTSATPTAPTWANPSGAGLPGGTTLTAVIGSQIAPGGAQIYTTSDTTGSYLLYWQNTAGVVTLVADATGAQVKYPLANSLAAVLAALVPTPGGSGSGLQFLDKRGLVIGAVGAGGVTLAGSLTAGTVTAPVGSFPVLNINNANFSYGPDGFRIIDKRGLIVLQLTAAGVLSAPMFSGGGLGGGSSYTPPTSTVASRKRIVSNHGAWGGQTGQTKSNGTTQLTGTDRFSWSANANCRSPEFVFVNGAIGAAGVLQPTGNAVQVALAVEASHSYASMYPEIGGCSGQPISSGGKTAYFIGDGAIAHSKPFPTNPINKGDTNYYRLHKKVSAGQFWPYSKVASDYTWGGVGTTDTVMGSTVTDGSDQSNTFATTGLGAFSGSGGSVSAWQAVAILGEQITPAPVVMVGGDSIGYGYGGTSLGRSYITRGLDAAGVAWWNGAMPGNDAYNLAMQDEIAAYLAAYVDHIIPHVGTNDIYAGTPVSPTLAAFQANFLLLAKHWARPGCKVWFCTLLPRVTSTDTLQTYANQTRANTTNVPGGTMSAEALRIVCNNWLMDATSTGAASFFKANLPYGAAQWGGIIDGRALIERNSTGTALALDGNGQQVAGTGGYWPVNGTAGYASADGIHPSDAMQLIMSAAVPSSAAFALT
ncbi:phage tail fiber protein [Novosphingobium sp.]|uniref:phage tail fiber domain-containing protein n=1 Tax=Novosphingobium sp. TaxID=1874826 RepID=UPI003B517078